MFGHDISRVTTCVVGRVRRRGIFIVFNAFPLHFSLTSCVPLAFSFLSVSVSVSLSLVRSVPLYLPPSPLSLSVSVYLSTMCQYVSSNTHTHTHTQPVSHQDIRGLCSLVHTQTITKIPDVDLGFLLSALIAAFTTVRHLFCSSVV